MRRDASVGVDLYGRDVSASKALQTVGSNADKLATKVTHVGDKIVKAMAVATVAVGAAAVKIGIDSVKAAMEDAKSVAVLQKAIQNSTKATKAQTAAVEDYITKQELRFGIEDTKLRSGLGRLVRSTHDVTKAQKMLNTSMSISAASGKDLDAVTTAVAKAYDGNLGALSRLGVGIPKALLKTKDFGKVWEYLNKQVRGFAYREADTAEGKMRRIRVAFDEAKESLGYMLMDALTPYMKQLTELVPKIQQWIDANGPQLKAAFQMAIEKVQAFLDAASKVVSWLMDHKDGLSQVAVAIAGVYGALKLYAGYKVIVTGIQAISAALTGFAAAEAAAGTAATVAAGPIAALLTLATAAATALTMAFVAETTTKMPAGKDAGGVPRNLPSTVDWAVDKARVPQTAGDVRQLSKDTGITNVYVQGSIIDREGFLRALNDADRIRRARLGQGS